MKWSAVVAVVLAALPGVGACTKNDPLYCAEGRPCRAADEDPTLNFCDVDGLYPASGGHGHTCIPSPFDAGVGVDAGVADASPAQDGGATATVTVSITGSGAGTVSSVPGGIDCGLVCASAFDVGSTVTLTAVPAAGSDFLGWSGPCAEPGPCIFTVGGDAAAEARFEPSGKSVWVARVGDVSDDIVKAAATLPDGDVVIGGSFGGMVMVGTQPLMSAGLSDAFIAKLARLDGAAQWAIRFGGTGADEVTGLATTADGDVVLAGTFSGAIDIGGMPVASNGAASDLVIARLRGTDGTTVWAKRVGGVGADLGGGVAVDKDGNVLVTARFTGTDILGVTTLNSAGGTDILVAKLAGADGAFLWAKAFGSMSNDAGIAIAADEDGNVLVTGSFQGTMVRTSGRWPAAGQRTTAGSELRRMSREMCSSRGSSATASISGPPPWRHPA